MEVLFYLVAYAPYLIAMVLGFGVALAFFGAFQSLVVGLGLICATSFLETFNLAQPILRLGVTIFVPDLPMILIGLVGGLRWLTRRDLPRRHAGWVVLALVFFVGLAQGLVTFGTSAGVAARPDFYAIAAATYVMSFPVGEKQVRQFFKVLSMLAVALLVLAACRWVVFYTPITDLLPPGGVYSRDGAIRVIGANHTLAVAQVMIVCLFFAGTAAVGQAARLLSPLLLAGVLVLQHRSVWLAAVAGAALSLLLVRAQRAPLWQQIFVLLVVASAAAAPVFFNAAISDQVRSSAERALAGTDTVDARFGNWRTSINQWREEGPRGIVLGRLPGADARRVIETESGQRLRIGFDVHNHYISTLTEQGVVGLLALVWVLGYVVLGLWRMCARHDEHSPTSALLLVLVGMQMVYFVAYTVDYVQYMVLGIALAWVASHARAAAPVAVVVSAAARKASAAKWGAPST
jgi:hypothetical protein